MHKETMRAIFFVPKNQLYKRTFTLYPEENAPIQYLNC